MDAHRLGVFVAQVEYCYNLILQIFLKKERKKVLILKFLTEKILLITVCIINKDIEQYWS